MDGRLKKYLMDGRLNGEMHHSFMKQTRNKILIMDIQET